MYGTEAAIIGDQAQCFLAFACIRAAEKNNKDAPPLNWAKPSKESWPLSEREREDVKRFQRIENIQERQQHDAWRRKQLALKEKWGTTTRREMNAGGSHVRRRCVFA